MHIAKIRFLQFGTFYRIKLPLHPLTRKQRFYRSPPLQLQPRVLVILVCFQLIFVVIGRSSWFFRSLHSHVQCSFILLKANLQKNRLQVSPRSSTVKALHMHTWGGSATGEEDYQICVCGKSIQPLLLQSSNEEQSTMRFRNLTFHISHPQWGYERDHINF